VEIRVASARVAALGDLAWRAGSEPDWRTLGSSPEVGDQLARRRDAADVADRGDERRGGDDVDARIVISRRASGEPTRQRTDAQASEGPTAPGGPCSSCCRVKAIGRGSDRSSTLGGTAMRRSVFVIVGLAAPAAILALFSTSGVVSGSSDAVYRTASPHREIVAAVSVVRRTRGLRVIYLGPDKFSVKPQGESGAGFTCPAKTLAISGILSLNRDTRRGAVVMSNSNPFGSAGRKWDVGVRNLSDQTQKFDIGAVCVGSGAH